MQKQHFQKIILIGGGLMLLLIGCVQTQKMTMLENFSAKLQSDKYTAEINKLERRVQQEADSAKRMQIHFELAQLYLSYKNPKRNYQMALKHLEIYASLNSQAANQHALRNWLSALKEIDRLSEELKESDKNIDLLSTKLKKTTREKIDLQKANAAFKHRNIKLKQQNSTLEASNLNLAKTIEMLKNLDRRVEEKRKNFNNQ